MSVADADADTKTANSRGGLTPQEIFWRDHQQWLETRGYMLSSRYKPDWTPSWKVTKKSYLRSEDGYGMTLSHLLDAVRISDGKVVMLKRISRKVHPHEVEISQLFSSPELAADPHNHCVPIYDVLQVPEDEDLVILVMPLLRGCDDPPFETAGEAVEFIHEMYQGLQFMHKHHVAHRDCMNLNMMMDPTGLYPKLYHPRAPTMTRDLQEFAKYLTRTERPVKYYLIDFGLSIRFDAEEAYPAAVPILGGDKTVPEFQDEEYLLEAHNPFPSDVYYLGNMVRQYFLRKYYGLEFLDALVADMVQDDPTKRPSIDEAMTRFEETLSKIKYWKLRARLVARSEARVIRILKNTRHVFRTAKFIVQRYPPIPTPAS
ncbi:kinase-like domain-containing protein [Amylocystis lapponica]|nr:kinase-like domain-containing protein [Amylocystis lapponica]